MLAGKGGGGPELVDFGQALGNPKEACPRGTVAAVASGEKCHMCREGKALPLLCAHARRMHSSSILKSRQVPKNT